MSERSVSNHRRYCFLQYRAALPYSDDSEQVWDGKRRTLLGTDIPATFPARAALISAGYVVLEELRGADETELTRAGLSSQQAAAVVAALV